MPLIEAALAFAITMLALSLVVSSIVEIIHRVFSMREGGLKKMLGQMFDQVLGKYLTDDRIKELSKELNIPNGVEPLIDRMRKAVKTAFVERMRANRAPMGVTPKATPTDEAKKVGSNKNTFLGLWNGRDLADMTPTEFMERLGSIDVGKEIMDTVTEGGQKAADVADGLLKGIAQKFEALGSEASSYFEGRARLLSVSVAVLLALAAHVDAVDLFKTYLRDPNARQKVIDQTEAVTAQHKAAAESAKALAELAKTSPSTDAEIKKQVDALIDDAKTAVTGAKAAIKQYADLGAPIGWSTERINAAKMSHWLWTCKDDQGKDLGWETLRGKCKADAEGYKDGPQNTQYREVWVQVPTSLPIYFYLVLGGFLIGLGSPFWYNAVAGLTNIRNTARGTTGADSQDVRSQAAVAAVAAGKSQPVTPVGAFQVSHAATKIGDTLTGKTQTGAPQTGAGQAGGPQPPAGKTP